MHRCEPCSVTNGAITLRTFAVPSQRRSKTRGWQDQFFFMESQMLPGDFDNLNFYCANSPTSLFYHVRGLWCFLPCLQGTVA